MGFHYGRNGQTKAEVFSESSLASLRRVVLGQVAEYIIIPSYEHTIVGTRRLAEPICPKGGILADDMGLGKTLTMISAIAISLDKARAFKHSHNLISRDDETQCLRRAGPTLVIVPSAGKLRLSSCFHTSRCL